MKKNELLKKFEEIASQHEHFTVKLVSGNSIEVKLVHLEILEEGFEVILQAVKTVKGDYYTLKDYDIEDVLI